MTDCNAADDMCALGVIVGFFRLAEGRCGAALEAGRFCGGLRGRCHRSAAAPSGVRLRLSTTERAEKRDKAEIQREPPG